MTPLQVIEWQAPEYTFHPKNKNWYSGVLLVAVILSLLSLFTKNFLLVILIIVASFAVMMYGARQPDVVKFAVTHRGVRFHTQIFPYDYLKSFWILEANNQRKLILVSERLVLPHVVIPIAEQVNTESLRQYLLPFLPEVRTEESLADVLSDYFGF